MKLKLMTIMMTFGLVMIPFINASPHGVENDSLNVGGAQLTAAAYRVTLNGFRVNRETYDTAFETDGKGDEVFVVSEAALIDRTFAVRHRVSRRSKTYGDINGFTERVQAGGRSDKGGLKTGDRAPNRDLSQPRPAGTRILNDDFPMLLWQGNLYDGNNAVVIMPTIWEWDLRSINFPPYPGAVIAHDVPPDLQLQYYFDRWIGNDFGRFVATRIRTVFRSPFVGQAQRAGWAQERSNADIFTMGTNGTRVIGLRPAERVASTDVFHPSVLILTFAGAEQVLRNSNGIFELTYEEPRCCGLEGSYTLFLQLERLPAVRFGP